MQYRLTKKFAVDCRIESLSTPCNTMSPLDDWFIDVFRVNRKKIAMVTHAISTYTFFVPYAEVGGARMIPGHINKLLTDFLYRENFTQHLLRKSLVSDLSFWFLACSFRFEILISVSWFLCYCY